MNAQWILIFPKSIYEYISENSRWIFFTLSSSEVDASDEDIFIGVVVNFVGRVIINKC